ncbi:hypothetical protein HYFRA_00013262 [Hymenoscyphus fraxineus]|uniref:Helicase ATP-binding domain-containing protein n=1 Tax=Hymenoscyphus fraxineus TaxID=746836 RepID=A0A9N9PVC3_9HELO|nr:hypothetical protein HYFRA_00013262 [Hymenoscyphus fraxineus]
MHGKYLGRIHEYQSQRLSLTEVAGSEAIDLKVESKTPVTEISGDEMDIDEPVQLATPLRNVTTESSQVKVEPFVIQNGSSPSDNANLNTSSAHSTLKIEADDLKIESTTSEIQVEFAKKNLHSTKITVGNKESKNPNKRKRVASSPKIKSSKKHKDGKTKSDSLGILQTLVNHNVIPKAAIDIETSAEFSASNKKEQFEALMKNLPKTADIKQAREDRTNVKKAATALGQKIVKPDGDKWEMAGFNTLLNELLMSFLVVLYAHQLIGIAWMYRREVSSDKGSPRGGICADSMGLGKTLQALAIIQVNPAKLLKRLNTPKTTLIVVPTSLIQQWRAEIKKHANFPRVLIYKSSDDQHEAIHYTDQDIVLTTWWELSRSCPFPPKEEKNGLTGKPKNEERDNSLEVDSKPTLEWIQDNREKGGLLHQIDWYRIILDESNHMSGYSLSAAALKGKHRWALSGTPVMNSLEGKFHVPLTLEIVNKIRVLSVHAIPAAPMCYVKSPRVGFCEPRRCLE